MKSTCCVVSLCVVIGLASSALQPVPHRTSEESLRGALDAVTRKQRSLASNAYYADEEDAADDEDSLAFIPAEANGQLETIGDGYQHLNNKQFSRALMDYLYTTGQGSSQPVQSVFRERERTGSQKRGGISEGGRPLSGRELAQLLLENSEDESTEDRNQLEDEEYQRTLQQLYERYRDQLANQNLYEEQALRMNALLGEQEGSGQDPRYLIPMAERRNVNARYPLFNREYKAYWDRSKRFPVAKRSTKALNRKRQATDPKVAEDLGPLFGTQSPEASNHNHTHDHDHEHSHDHDHSHDHKNEQHEHHDTSESSSSNAKVKNLKDSQPPEKTKERPIEVKKKSIDWSNYFGIDRRKKKSVYYGRPNTKDQDDEYLLQQYYELMAENLNPSSRDSNPSAKRDKQLQQMDTRLKNMKNMMIEEAVQIGSKGDFDTQQAKDEEMSRLTAAYNLEKLRRALYELSSAARAQAQNSSTGPDKRNHRTNNINDELRVVEEEASGCPQIDIIERRCKATEALIGDFREVLHVPCVMYHICNTCNQEECLERFALEAERICQEDDMENTPWSQKHCMQAAMTLPRYAPAISTAALCLTDEGESCVIRYERRHRQRAAGYRHRSAYER